MSRDIILPGGDTLKLFDSTYTASEVEAILTKALRQPGDSLLRNAYFIGGGSQQGGGQFPINQRGLTEYTGLIYGHSIDGWNINALKVTLESDGILCTPENVGDNDHKIWQQIESIAQGLTITFSALVDGILYSVTGTSGRFFSYQPTANLMLESNFLYGKQYGLLRFQTPQKVTAARLEPGDQQTLARQDDNGNWVLNDPPPNFALELLKCQRYYSKDTVYLSNVQGTDGWVMYNLSYPTMRATPTITATVTETDATGTLSSRRAGPSDMLLSIVGGKSGGDQCYWYGTIERSAEL